MANATPKYVWRGERRYIVIDEVKEDICVLEMLNYADGTHRQVKVWWDKKMLTEKPSFAKDYGDEPA